MAHELGNPLNNISLMAQTYLSVYDMLGDEEKKTYMGDVYNQTERIQQDRGKPPGFLPAKEARIAGM